VIQSPALPRATSLASGEISIFKQLRLSVDKSSEKKKEYVDRAPSRALHRIKTQKRPNQPYVRLD
jgi:hypothetical protein